MTTTTNTVDKDFLQFYRLKSGLTQAELKKMAGYPNIGKVERGNVVLSNDDASDKVAIKRIAKALKIRPEQLLCLDERAAAENSAANKFASLNLCAMRNARQSSHKEVGVSLGFHEKNAGVLVFEFECGRRIFPPDELTRIAADIFGESAESHEKQKEFLAREFTAAEIVYIYSGAETNREVEADKPEETAAPDTDYNTRGRKKKDIGSNSPFATRLRELLEERKITQPVLAEAIGVSRQSVGQWKDGKTVPDILDLQKIAHYFGVSTDYLLCQTDDVDERTESGSGAEYELHLADGRVIPVKGSRYGGDICYEFYIARKKAVLEYVQNDGSIFICRKKDIFYIIRKGEER